MVALLAALFASEKPLVTIDAFGLNHEHEILNLLPGNGTAECTEINMFFFMHFCLAGLFYCLHAALVAIR